MSFEPDDNGIQISNGTPTGAAGLAINENWATISALIAAALKIANNLSDLQSAATARTHLGLGSAATQASSAFDATGSASAALSAAEASAAATYFPLTGGIISGNMTIIGLLKGASVTGLQLDGVGYGTSIVGGSLSMGGEQINLDASSNIIADGSGNVTLYAGGGTITLETSVIAGVSSASLQISDGFTGAGNYTSFSINNGIITAAS